MDHFVKTMSAELTCYHEAGHAAVALHVGARLVEMELYLDPPPPHGRMRLERTLEQAKLIALGGFVAEYYLYRAQRYTDTSGQLLSEKAFIHEAVVNAVADRVSYFGGNFERADGTWPPDMDRAFINAAIALHNGMFGADIVERFAAALLANAKLDEADILSLSSSSSPS